MKNKLLVSVFAMAIAAFAFTSCETKSNVTAVCTDMVKESIHKSPRSLVVQDGQKLSIVEYEFPGGVNDNKLVYRTIAFGNGVNEPKKVENLTYEYGEWKANNTEFTILVTPASGDPYTLVYKGNALVTPNGQSIGGEGTNNTARVDKWEKTIASFPNTEWEGLFEGDYVTDSVFEDSIRTIFIPPMTFITDTIKVFKGEMDTLSADTTCYYRFELNRNASTFANTGHFYQKSIRSKYNRETGIADIISETEREYDCTWYFSDVTSDAKFVITLTSTNPAEKGDVLSISKYKLNDAGVPAEFQLGGLTFTRPVLP